MTVTWLFKLAFKLKSIAQTYKIIEAAKDILEKKNVKMYSIYIHFYDVFQLSNCRFLHL